MSNIKCPLCGGDLIQSKEFPYFYSCQSTNWKSDADKLCELDDCAAPVPVWETLRRTRKALEIAVDALKEYSCKSGNWAYGYEFIDLDGNHTAGYKADTALEQITALEQKERK